MRDAILSTLAAFITLRSSSVCAFSQPRRRVTPPRFGTGATSSTSSTTTSLFSAPPASSSSRALLPEGISKTTTVDGTGRPIRVGDSVVVKYHCNAAGGGDDDANDANEEASSAFARSDGQRVVAGDGTMVRGWDAALLSMREGERATVRISDPRYGYGDAGVPPFVPPNAEILIDLEVLNVEDGGGGIGSFAAQQQSSQGTGSATSMSALDDLDGPVNRPRTPASIAAAYESKMRTKALNALPEKEGIEWAIDKIRTSYFFGLFEGETGQEAPWYLKPSITFPIAFLVVGAAFWVSLAGGAIRERGMPSTDELDEIIISMDVVRAAGVAVALSMIQV